MTRSDDAVARYLRALDRLGTVADAVPAQRWDAPTPGVATPLGPRTVEQLLGVALVEPVVHSWDLATATGRPADLDPDAVQALLPGVLALGGQLQASGMYGPPVPVPDDAPAQDRLLAALGRRPHGSPG